MILTRVEFANHPELHDGIFSGEAFDELLGEQEHHESNPEWIDMMSLYHEIMWNLPAPPKSVLDSISFYTEDGWKRFGPQVKRLCQMMARQGKYTHIFKLYWDPDVANDPIFRVLHKDLFQVIFHRNFIITDRMELVQSIPENPPISNTYYSYEEERITL